MVRQLYEDSYGTNRRIIMKLEICCGSYQDCLAAQKGGASRIELNSALYLGGLTPNAATVKLAKANGVTLPIVCMVRPRAAGFHYNEDEVAEMFAQAKDLLDAGSDGLAFGFLTNDAKIDVELTKKMVDLIHSYQAEAVFHRAFDCVSNEKAAIETLIELGVDRILTSGLYPTAIEGKGCIKELVKEYGDRMQILAGSGIKPANVADFVAETGVGQVHSSAKTWFIDPTTTAPHCSYAYHEANDYDGVDVEIVKNLVKELKLGE